MAEQEVATSHSDRVVTMTRIIGDTLGSFEDSFTRIATAEKGTHAFGGGDSHQATLRLELGFNRFRTTLGQLNHFTRPLETPEAFTSDVVYRRIVADALRQVAKNRQAATPQPETEQPPKSPTYGNQLEALELLKRGGMNVSKLASDLRFKLFSNGSLQNEYAVHRDTATIASDRDFAERLDALIF